jgi:hypothetical protein
LCSTSNPFVSRYSEKNPVNPFLKMPQAVGNEVDTLAPRGGALPVGVAALRPERGNLGNDASERLALTVSSHAEALRNRWQAPSLKKSFNGFVLRTVTKFRHDFRFCDGRQRFCRTTG